MVDHHVTLFIGEGRFKLNFLSQLFTELGGLIYRYNFARQNQNTLVGLSVPMRLGGAVESESSLWSSRRQGGAARHGPAARTAGRCVHRARCSAPAPPIRPCGLVGSAAGLQRQVSRFDTPSFPFTTNAIFVFKGSERRTAWVEEREQG